MTTLGVTFRPPSIGMVFEDPKRGKSKSIYRLRLKGLSTSTDLDTLAKRVANKFSSKLFDGEEISEVQVRTLLNRILNNENDDAPATMKYADQDLNKLDDESLNRVKADMQKDFNKNALRPGEEGFVYDKQIDFGSGDEDASWDEEEEEETGE